MDTVEEVVKHNHKKNFGRYVADCPKCIEKYPAGPPVRARKRTPVVFSRDQLLHMLEELSDSQHTQADSQQPQAITMTKDDLVEALRTLGQELRKGTPEEEAKRADELLRRRNAQLQMAETLVEQARLIKANQDNCRHTMPRGENAVFGQVHGDGMYHPLCVVCMKEFPPQKPSREQFGMLATS